MAQPNDCRIHPTAIISPDAILAEDVRVGAYAIIDGPVEIGPECIVKPLAQLVGAVKMGCGNQVFSGAIIGDAPQHLKYQGEKTSVEIGNNNIFRENVTVHRGTTQSWVTRIGDNNFFMAGSHVAHDCVVGSNCIFANNALLAGHCVIENQVIMSGNSAVHQFCRVGRLALISGCSGSSKDVPPFIIQQGINNVAGVNIVGMKRAGVSKEEINSVRKAFRYIFMEGCTLPQAMEKIEKELGQFDAAQELLQFLRSTENGINPMRPRGLETAA